MTEKLRNRIGTSDITPLQRRARRPTVVEHALPTGIGSTVKALERLISAPVESSDGIAVLDLTHRLRMRGFGVEAVVTVRLAGQPDTLTVDVTLAETAHGTCMLRLATRGTCRDGFHAAHAVLHDIARALDAECEVVHARARKSKMSPWSSTPVTAHC